MDGWKDITLLIMQPVFLEVGLGVGKPLEFVNQILDNS